MALEKVLAFEEYGEKWWEVDTMFGNKHQNQLRFSWWEREIAKASGVPIVALRCNGYSGTVVEMRHQDEIIKTLNGYEFLLRSFQARPEFVGQLGGKPNISVEETNLLYRWPLVVDNQFTKRKMGVVPLSELFPDKESPDWNVLNPYQKCGKVFIKTMRKHRDLVYRRNHTHTIAELNKDSSLLDIYGDFLKNGSIDNFIVSQPLEFDPIGYQPIEYRVFVANGRIAGINTNENVYRKNETPISVGRFAQKFVRCHKEILPWGYVIDIGLVDSEPILVEVNHLSASGRFSGHDFSIVLEEFSADFDRKKLEAAFPKLLQQDAQNLERSYGKRTFGFMHGLG